MRALSTTAAFTLSLLVGLPALAQGEAPPAEAAPAAEATPAAAPAAEAAPAEPVPAEPAPAEPAMKGSVSVSSQPAGKVFLDGNDTGLTTPVVDLEVEPGTHTLKVVEEATGRAKEVTFHLEAGSALNLNLNLPEAVEPVATDATTDTDTATTTTDAAPVAQAAPADDWTWMTVAGWAALGVGTLGLLAGAVVLTTPTDPDQGPLGFGLFGVGAGLVLGGGVLLYLDSELADSQAANAPAGGDASGAQTALRPLVAR